jgi:formylglycine-generating enzyme required for sulfatase activity
MNGLRTATLCIVGLYLTAISSTVAPSIGEESPITTKGTQTSLTNSVDMKMVLLKPGDVWLGIPDKNDDSKRFYWPRKVWISEPFYLANTEVTQEQHRSRRRRAGAS